MSGITDLGTLLEAMKPERVSGEFVFCSVSEEQLADLSLIPKLMFREDEGITLILHKESAEQSGL
ncbi:MAG: ACT domain-containing protein, partial [Candidatus Aminicenantales bacterium]